MAQQPEEPQTDRRTEAGPATLAEDLLLLLFQPDAGLRAPGHRR